MNLSLRSQDYLVEQTEQMIIVPQHFNTIYLQNLDTQQIFSLRIHEPTLNHSLIVLFTDAFRGEPKGVVVWDYELKHIDVLLLGNRLELLQFDIKNSRTTVAIPIRIWLE